MHLGVRTLATGLTALGLAAAAPVTLRGAHASTTATPSPRCATAQLRISIAPVSGGLEHAGIALEFRDRGAICTLRGYPGVAGLSPAGATVFNAHRTPTGYLGGARAISLVTLSRGQSASALLEWLDIPTPGQRCRRYQRLEVTPPGDRTSVPLPLGGRLCGPDIHPVVRGRRAGAGT